MLTKQKADNTDLLILTTQVFLMRSLNHKIQIKKSTLKYIFSFRGDYCGVERVVLVMVVVEVDVRH